VDVFILESDAVQIVVLNKVTIVILLFNGGLFTILSFEQGNELRRIAVFLKKVAVALAIAVTREVLRKVENKVARDGYHSHPPPLQWFTPKSNSQRGHRR